MADDTFTNDLENRSEPHRVPPGANGGSAQFAANSANDRASFDAPGLGDAERNSRSRRSEHSPAALLRQLVNEAALLFRKEIALAASEVSQSIDRAKTGAISMVSGGAVLYAGLLFLLGAAALALAMVVPAWAAWLIVGAATTVVGMILVTTGKNRVSANSFTPDRTVDALRKDSVAIRRQMS